MKRVNGSIAFTKSEVKQIVRLYTKKKLSLGAVADTMAVSTPTIRRILTDNKVTIRPRGRQPQAA